MKLRSLALLAALTLAPAGAARALGAADVMVGGLLDAALSSRGTALELNRLSGGNTSFDAYRMRVFVEGRPIESVEIHAQLYFDETIGAQAYGAYAIFTPRQDLDAHLLIGKLPTPLGTYAPRTYSDRNPLIGTPLIYQYHSSLRADEIPGSADDLLAEAGSGQSGAAYDAQEYAAYGMPILDEAYWDVGVVAQGSARAVEYAIGYVNGTPGSPQPAQDDNGGKSVQGRLGLQAGPAVRVGVSGSYGPYLSEALNPELPAGRTANDYAQRLLMVDGEFLAGPIELRAEGALNRWQTPTVGDLDVNGGYVEGRFGVGAGAWISGRLDALRHSEVADSTGAKEPWDYDVDRFEAGIGYRLARGSTIKLVLQRTTQIDEGARFAHDLYAVQYSVRF
jgi:hypothetical protein